MERCATVAFDLAGINDLMLLVRDDLALIGRGVAWCRYESGKGDGYYDHEKVCIDFKSRRDFLHSIVAQLARGDVGRGRELPDARRGAQAVPASTAATPTRRPSTRSTRRAKEIGGADNRERAKFWEIWDKGDERVFWVAEGCEDILDEDDPHLDLQNFFPCPKPAYGTVQRGIAGAGARRAAVPGPARRGQPADRAHPRAVATRSRRRASIRPAAPSSPTRCRPR